jgi:hypothetical protein
MFGGGWLASMAAGVLGIGSPVQAQINVQQTSVAGRDATRNNLANVPLSIDECEQNVEIMFLIEDIPMDKTRLDFWSNGSACNTTEQRSDTTGTCELLDTFEINNRARIPDLAISAQSLFDCEETDTPTFFVLAVNSPNDEVDTK